MSLMIPYDSQDFPSAYGIGSGNLTTSWDDLLWAGLTVGRPNTAYVFQHGEASFYEALFRLSLIRMTVEQDHFGELTENPDAPYYTPYSDPHHAGSNFARRA